MKQIQKIYGQPEAMDMYYLLRAFPGYTRETMNAELGDIVAAWLYALHEERKATLQALEKLND